jgi:predicted nuclease with TOPRIM domain
MLARSRTNTRLSALEAYVDMPEERRGMTVTGRLDGQHTLLLALRTDVTELRSDMIEVKRRLSNVEHRLTNVEHRLTNVEQRLTNVEQRLGEVELTLGQILYALVEIKNLLRPPGGPSEGPSPNGHGPPGG